MKRLLHALAALWPERRGEGSPPVPDTQTDILQHRTAVLRMDRLLSECVDSPIRKFAKETVGADAPGEFFRSDGGLNVSKPEPSKSANTQIRESVAQPKNLTHISRPMPLLTIVIPVIFMCLMAAKQVSAQAEPAVAAQIKPLQIGDAIPEELWHLPLQVVNHPDGKDTITLNDYRDKKLIILDFWATWCKPCLESLNRLDSLRDSAFAKDLAVIPIQAFDSERRALAFIERHNWKRYSVVNDQALHPIAFSRYLTAFGTIWLANGKFYGAPSYSNLNAKDIAWSIQGNPSRMENQPVQNQLIQNNPLND